MHQRGRAFALIAAGAVLLLAAGIWWGLNLLEDRKAGQASAAVIEVLRVPETVSEQTVPTGTKSGKTDEEPAYESDPLLEYETRMVDGRSYIGTLKLDRLGMELPVLDDWSYSNLKIAPCRYEGTPNGKLTVIAHNYAHHFRRLQELMPEDAVVFSDVRGRETYYRVIRTETLNSTDAERLRIGEWDLTLVTCTYGGRYRIAVRLKKAE